tara:strand:+ start:3201 stop:3461 length:261 start_codon:yes stop_codon:yes gene_type:complete
MTKRLDNPITERLSVYEGGETGSFLYTFSNGQDYREAGNLEELLDVMNFLDIDILEENPIYQIRDRWDVRILEGKRREIIEYFYES